VSVGSAVLFFFCGCGVAGLTVLVLMDAMHFFFFGFGTMRTLDGIQSPFTCLR
jgi:hypothetical protein